MTDLLSKINTLIRARVEGFLSEDLGLPLGRPGRAPLSADRLGKDIDREVAALRRRIDAALERDENLQTQIAALRQEAADWDLKADNALLEKDEATARHAVAQIQRLEERAALLEADLAQLRRNTAELIDRVNVLEGLVADARRQQGIEPPAAPRQTAGPPPAESQVAEPPTVPRQTAEPPPAPTLEAVLQTTRCEIEALEAEEKRLAAAQDQARQVVETIQVEDDLALRRQRLARRDTPSGG